ncbi:MAG: MFS transporter [Solirubrobacterales bacterium]|nr:MFS transporter [Solirubrobacterales bacterium]
MRGGNPGAASTNALLFVVCLAQFMVILDIAVVNVALPSMRTGLHFSTTGLQWVVNAYTLTFAGFLMLGGRSADLLGRRRLFLVGTALFAVSSLACAMADSRTMLIAARALQGFGGAVIAPATLSIITSSLPEGAERNRGLGLWAAVGGLGASSGALLGGVLTQVFGWPAIFAINVPVGAAVILLGLRFLPSDIRIAGPRHFDASGAVLMTTGLVALTYGIVRTDTLGWGSPGVLIPLALAAGLIGAFAYVEARVAQAPLVPLSIFKLPQLRAANLVVVLMYSALFSMFFFVTLYLQQVLGDDALQAGLSFLPITLSVFTASTLAPRMVARFGVRAVVTFGMLCAALGLVLLTGVRPGGSYFDPVLPGGVLSGFGMGFGLVASTIAATQGVPRTQSGLASGLLNTSRLMGGALGLAVLSTIAAASSHLTAGISGAEAMTNGFTVAFQLGAAICVAGAIVAALLLRSSAQQPEVDVVESRERALEEAAEQEPLAA